MGLTVAFKDNIWSGLTCIDHDAEDHGVDICRPCERVPLIPTPENQEHYKHQHLKTTHVKIHLVYTIYNKGKGTRFFYVAPNSYRTYLSMTHDLDSLE